ncbi:hypothetical protein D3C75_929800 [compost metagenome]
MPRGILEHPEPELRRYGQDVVEYIRLNSLVYGPLRRIGEGIDFDGQPVGPRLQLSDHPGHAGVDAGMPLDIMLNVRTEDADIGQGTAVHPVGAVDAILQIVLFNFLRLLVNIIPQIMDFAEGADHLRGTKHNAPGIHIDRPFDPPSP